MPTVGSNPTLSASIHAAFQPFDIKKIPVCFKGVVGELLTITPPSFLFSQ